MRGPAISPLGGRHGFQVRASKEDIAYSWQGSWEQNTKLGISLVAYMGDSTSTQGDFWVPSQIFTESALRPIQSVSRDVRLHVCLSVRHTLETTLPEGLESSGRRAYR